MYLSYFFIKTLGLHTSIFNNFSFLFFLLLFLVYTLWGGGILQVSIEGIALILHVGNSQVNNDDFFLSLLIKVLYKINIKNLHYIYIKKIF